MSEQQTISSPGITRRELLSVGAIAGISGCGGRSTSDRRPNILLAFSDDQSWPHASILGDPVVKTPAFDRVAQEGVLFNHSYTACPSCSPSRAALLTGRQIWQIGEAGLLYGTLPQEYPLVTHQLEDAGYHVGFVGKPWAPGDWKAAGLARHPIGTEYDSRLEPDPPYGIDIRDYAANFDDFLADRSNDSPFFFWFGCTEPHREYETDVGMRSGLDLNSVVVPPYLPDAPEVRRELLDYYYEIQHFDNHLGRMLESLERIGELDNTLVIVTSDNGMPYTRTKATLYDSGTRMPTAIRWRDQIPGGRRIDDFTSHCDLAPTFLEVAGLAPLNTHTGRSLMPLLTVENDGLIDPERDHVVTGMERHTWCRPEGATYPMRSIRTHDYLYIRNFNPDRWPTGGPEFISSNKAPHGDVDDGPFKDFMLRPETQQNFPREFELGFGKRPLEELYDCRADPHQLNNLARDKAYQKIREELWVWLESELRAGEDPRVEGRDPWQLYPYRQVDGFGATFNTTLSEAERSAALQRGKHAVGYAKPAR